MLFTCVLLLLASGLAQRGIPPLKQDFFTRGMCCLSSPSSADELAEQLLDMDHEELVGRLFDSHGAHWWHMPQTDCSEDHTTGSCAGETVEVCKEICHATPGCRAFTYPEGHLRKVRFAALSLSLSLCIPLHSARRSNHMARTFSEPSLSSASSESDLTAVAGV
jgi:hypothetical protein